AVREPGVPAPEAALRRPVVQRRLAPLPGHRPRPLSGRQGAVAARLPRPPHLQRRLGPVAAVQGLRPRTGARARAGAHPRGSRADPRPARPLRRPGGPLVSTPTRPTVLDYLLRAGDAFIEALELYGPTVTAADEARAQRLTDYTHRCARRAAQTAGRDPALLEGAVEVRDMASRTQILLNAIHHTHATAVLSDRSGRMAA